MPVKEGVLVGGWSKLYTHQAKGSRVKTLDMVDRYIGLGWAGLDAPLENQRKKRSCSCRTGTRRSSR